ncbi:hypothetical protein SAMN06265365_113133 [Tistlia consotensis]|uniref:Histidine kinase VP0354-like sensor domain-containing protein n=1 Tax=Tistlia consotensis USBA 355 TaxID=560819 RepID=A0A1Y6C8T3_9PROT|nr:hypothetical protein [Tistlia consotensis]SMF40354.1 hypothetical protein SAMN05428998_11412 [Tistlia consotensis USBA 355]SNR75049.1 hypothetical protein SAMN06265365_113133 [Tistlia consotensis]
MAGGDEQSDSLFGVDTLRRAALVFAPLALAAALVVYLLFHVQATALRNAEQADEERVVEIGRQRGDGELAAILSDLRYLARQQALQRWLASPDAEARQALAEDYHAFAAEKSLYDQIRLIAPDGRELVRVNWNGGSPVVVPDDQLQDKAARPYVAETLKRGPGAI